MNFQSRINAAFKDENLRRKDAGEPRLTKTNLWQAAKLTSAAATFWFNGDNAADMVTCMKIAPLLRVNAQWLFDGTGSRHPSTDGDEHVNHAPILQVDAKASAGKGSLVFSEDTSRALMFRRDWLAKKGAKPRRTFAVEVDGNSMTDMHITHGSIVLANRDLREPLPKRLYVVWIEGRLYVKQLVLVNGIWVARSHCAAEASKYPDIPIEDPNAKVEGQVFWCGFEL